MDAVVFLAIALVLAWHAYEEPDSTPTKTNVEVVKEDTVTRTAKLNEDFYDDPDAFMDIAKALGFPKEPKR